MRFRAPLLYLVLEDLSTPDTVFQIGVVPQRIDLLTSISGVAFDEAWRARIEIDVDGLHFAVIGRDELLRNKKSTGRPKDQADAIWLESEPDAEKDHPGSP